MFAKVSAWLKPPIFDNKEQEKIARTLTILLTLVLVGATILAIVRLVSGTQIVTAYAAIVLAVAALFLLWLVRRGEYIVPSYATPIIILFLFLYVIAQDQGLHDIGLPALSLSIVLAALMLGKRGAILLTGLTMLGVLLLGVAEISGSLQSVLSPTTGIDDVIIIMMQFGFVGLIVSIMVGNLSDSLREQKEATAQLQTLSASLENKVEERVRDLALAAGIGNNLSQERDMETLLRSAVHLIRDRFNLYYVQIYLLNKTGSILQLEVGTGNIGQELTRRGHRLPVGPGSIAGMAAAARKPVIVPDTALDPMFRPNLLLPLTRSEAAVPLLVGDQVVGVLDLQDSRANALSLDSLAPFEALSGQLAVAIENAALLAESQAARAELEAYTRRITRESWSAYLDGVERPQFWGFHYDGSALMPLSGPPPVTAEQNVARVPIEVVGEAVGAIEIEDVTQRHWTEEDLEFMQNVAQKVGQQVEILRSLDEASFYRQEAESALRRLTFSAWQSYRESTAVSDGFVYDQQQIRPLAEWLAADEADDAPLVRHPLRVRDEMIGELAVAADRHGDATAVSQLTAVVAEQLSQHLENLRLNATTEQALGEAQRRSYELTIINEVVTRLSLASGLQESMQIITEQMAVALQVSQVRIALMNEQEDGLVVIAEHYDPARSPSALNHVFVIQDNPLTQQVLTTQKTIYIDDVYTSPLTEPLLEMMREQGIYSLAIMPIILNNAVVGTLGIDILDEDEHLSAEQLSLAETILLQAATAIEKARLFEQTQARAEELEAINQIAQIVARQSDQTQLLNIVYEQIRRIMPVDAYFIALYDARNHLLEFPLIYDEGRTYQELPSPPSATSKVYGVIQSARPLLLNRAREEVEGVDRGDQAGFIGNVQKVSASLMYAPLRIGQEVLGVLSVQSYQLNAYDQSDLALLTGIASHVAVALDNARLLAEAEARVAEGQILRNLTASINTAVDAENVLRTAAREIGRALGLHTYVYLQEAETPQPHADNGGNGRLPTGAATETEQA